MFAEQDSPPLDSATNGNGQPNKPERDRKGRFAAGNRMGRGLAKVRGEWRLVCLTHNLLELLALRLRRDETIRGPKRFT